MRAISVQQPWAWAIIHAGKDVENRTRNIAGSYRGPVAIHASQRFDVDGGRDPRILQHEDYADAHLAFGAVIGVVDIVDVHHSRGEYAVCCASTWGEPFSNHLELAHPRPIADPIFCAGKLGLWTLPGDVFRDLRSQLSGVIPHPPRADP